MDVGVLLADRAEGGLSAGIAQGIDVCGRYVVIVGGLPIAEPDWVVPTCHVVPDWAGLDHGALSSGRLWFQSAGRPLGQASAGCHPPARAAAGKAGVWRSHAGVRIRCLLSRTGTRACGGSRESTLISPLSARSIPAPLGTRRRLRSPGSSVPLVRGVARWSVPDARPRGQLPGAPPPVLLPPAGWARLLPRKSPAWGTPVLRVL